MDERKNSVRDVHYRYVRNFSCVCDRFQPMVIRLNAIFYPISNGEKKTVQKVVVGRNSGPSMDDADMDRDDEKHIRDALVEHCCRYPTKFNVVNDMSCVVRYRKLIGGSR